MIKTRIKALAIIAALVVMFGTGVWAGITGRTIEAQTAVPTSTGSPQSGITLTLPNPGDVPTDVDASQLWRAWRLLDENFVQTHASNTIPTTQEKIYGAIAGLTATYNDPYTVFFPPSDAKVFNEDVSGSFGGVGMEMDNDPQGRLIVVSPLKGSPAEAAGILSGDLIVAVDRDAERGRGALGHAHRQQIAVAVVAEALAPAVRARRRLALGRADAVQRVVGEGLRPAGVEVVERVPTRQ